MQGCIQGQCSYECQKGLLLLQGNSRAGVSHIEYQARVNGEAVKIQQPILALK